MSANVPKTGPWSGYLTLENAPAVFDRVEGLIKGRTYTGTLAIGNHRPDVRPHQQAEKIDRKFEDGHAEMTVVDDSAIWWLDTTHTERQIGAQDGRDQTWVEIGEDWFMYRRANAYEVPVEWTVVLEDR